MSHNKLEKFVSMYYDRIRNLSFIGVNDPRIQFRLSDEVSDILGFTRGETYGGKTRHISPNHPDLDRGFASLYVYSSIAAPRLVGDAMTPLLRTVPSSGTDKFTNIYHEFTSRQYIPTGNFQSELIEVDIRTDSGAPVSFTSGKVVVTVHIRRKQQ